jgi:hypothetical protein
MDLAITIYGPKSLYRNARNQLKSHCTLSKFKVKNISNETGKKTGQMISISNPSPKLLLLMSRRKSPTHSFSIKKEREEWNINPTSQLLAGLSEGMLLSHLTQSIARETHILWLSVSH